MSNLLKSVFYCAVLSMVGCGRAKSGDGTHLRNAEKYFTAYDYESAEVEYKNALRQPSGRLVALRRLGAIWEVRGSAYQAGICFKQARKLAPRDVEVRLGLARSWLALRNPSDARAETVEALNIDPTNGDALILLAKSSFNEPDVNDTVARLAVQGMDEHASIHVARAILAMKGQDLESAGAEIERALSLAGDSPEVLVMKAQWHLGRREEPQAEDCLKKAAKLAPTRSPERIGYAIYLLNRGRRAEAVSLLEKTTVEAPDFLTPWRMLAKIAMSENDPGKAEKLLEKVLARDAWDFEGGILKAAILLSEKENDATTKALALLDMLKKAYPFSAMVELHRARAHLLQGNVKSASEAIDHALVMQPGMHEALVLQGRLRLSQARFDEVAGSMDVFLQQHPGDLETTLILSEAERRRGKAAAAASALAKITDPPVSDVRWHLESGLVSKNLGKTEDARSAFEKVETLEPGNLAAAEELVNLDMLAKDFDSALRRTETQRNLHPESASPPFLRATVLARQSRLKEAEEALQAALKLEPGMLVAYDLLVRIYSATGRREEAVGQLERVRKINPGNLQVLMILAGVYQSTGRKAETLECYEEALKKDPNFVPALNNLAVILSETPGGDLKRAVRLTLSARSSKPDDGGIADTLGWIVFKQGDFKRAQGLLSEAVAKVPENPSVKFHYGMVCRAMADEAGARDAFRQAIAAQPDFPGKSDAILHLARLEATIEPGEPGIRDLGEQVARDPSDVIARLRLGGLFETEGRHREAAEAYAGALKVNSELHRAVSRLAHLYAGPLNDPKKAYEYARKTRDLHPGDAQAAAIMGALAYRAGEYERADIMFRESLATIKDDTGLMIQGAWAAYSLGRLDEARKLMESVVAQSKVSQEQADGKRFLEFQSDDSPAEAITDALASDPEYVPALMARAAYAVKKDQKAAVEDYEKVLKVFPKFVPASIAIERIRSEKTAPP
ncbi:MAG: tetratricopeptide repeat protein [Luteolibacter sp.]